MTIRISSLAPAIVLVLMTGVASAGPDMEKIYADFEKHTGLVRAEVPDTGGDYLGKTHRGYQVLYTAKAGNVWGRYAARLTMGEIGREVGGVLGHLTGQRPSGVGTVVGSPLDRLLSELIGQPLAVTVLLDHGKAAAPRLEIVSRYSPLERDASLPERARISAKAGAIHAEDAEFASRIAANKQLMNRLGKLRGELIVVDDRAVAFLWAGSETDYSGMIRDHGGYWKMLNAIMDDLADIADAMPVSQ